MKHPFEEKVYKVIERAGLIEPGATVIVALSGGADSVALLSSMTSLATSVWQHTATIICVVKSRNATVCMRNLWHACMALSMLRSIFDTPRHIVVL